MRKLTEFERGWISGIIDSDGWIGLHKQKTSQNKIREYGYTGRGSIDSISKEFLLKIKKVVKLGCIQQLKSKGKGRYPNAKTLWRYSLCANGLRYLLPQIKLVIKERRRILLIEALKLSKIIHHNAHNEKIKERCFRKLEIIAEKL